MALRRTISARHLVVYAAFAISSPAWAQSQPSPPESVDDQPPILPEDEFEARLPPVEDNPTGAPSVNSSAPLPTIDSYLDQQMPSEGSEIGRAHV
jgi:translocation and assembly module TamA